MCPWAYPSGTGYLADHASAWTSECAKHRIFASCRTGLRDGRRTQISRLWRSVPVSVCDTCMLPKLGTHAAGLSDARLGSC